MKDQKKGTYFILPIILWLLFIGYTVLVLTVDRQPIGPQNSVVGLAGINAYFQKLCGSSTAWYEITSLIGKLSFLVVGLFAVLGIGQCIARRSVRKVNGDILLMGALYVLLGGAYVLFEKWIVNYRPMLVDQVLEASYPSSHTMLTCTIMGAAVVWICRNVGNRRAKVIQCAFMLLMMIAMAVGRLLSGVHWFSDVLGGVLISAAFVATYAAAARTIKS